MEPRLVDRYLRLLGVQRERPSADALRELVRAHLCRVPFENVSKLYFKKHLGLRGLPGLERFLAGIERYHFGGTCYPNNCYFYELLTSLGYRTTLCGADMSKPDVHLVCIVDLEDRQFLVDVGYAAPFFTPLPRDLKNDYVIEWGRDRYVLGPQDDSGRSRLELYRDGSLKHGYVVKPTPRRIGDFDKVIADSYRDEATFMNAILLARFFPDRSLVVQNLTVVEAGTTSKIHALTDRGELVRIVEERFGIPSRITAEAVDGLDLLRDAWD